MGFKRLPKGFQDVSSKSREEKTIYLPTREDKKREVKTRQDKRI